MNLDLDIPSVFPFALEEISFWWKKLARFYSQKSNIEKCIFVEYTRIAIFSVNIDSLAIIPSSLALMSVKLVSIKCMRELNYESWTWITRIALRSFFAPSTCTFEGTRDFHEWISQCSSNKPKDTKSWAKKYRTVSYHGRESKSNVFLRFEVTCTSTSLNCK